MSPGLDPSAHARLLLLLLALCWGLSWPAMRFALDEIGPWAMRFFGYVIGSTSLLLLLRWQGRSLSIPFGRAWLHVVVASVFNVVVFGLCSTFGQLMAVTSRVIIITYSMPIWGSLLAWLILRERIDARAWAGLGLCVAGLAVLVYPVAGAGTEPIGLLLALTCALTWAVGMIYMKWARIPGDILAITFWQVVLGVVVFAAGYLAFEGAPSAELPSWRAILGVVYNGALGTGLAYFIWFNIIGRLPAATASLGTLANPVVGVLGSMLLLGDRLTAADATGFALIFCAAACVLIAPAPPPAIRR